MRDHTVRISLAISLLAGVVLTIVGCATRHVELPPIYTPTYNYEPTESDGGTSIAIALLHPRYASEEDQNDIDEMGQAFQDSLEGSMLAYFTSNGFTVSGPFESMDSMTFPEKKQVDLVLQTSLAYRAVFPTLNNERHSALGNAWYVYSCSGDCSIAGGISFTLWEPLSQQRMWTKEVPVPKDTVPCDIEETTSSDFVLYTRYNASLRLLEALLAETMTQAERYFHPEEVRLVKRQAQELRERTVYGQ